ncbi:hypothetical protein PRIPAC_84165 [Pristionchus pacificus]|uniref:ubiquitinyl hydrolase 1 n=1 Tax=Pristionchus pacificus TaxID=54126 RepID=A0A2A6BLW3_PRIPA|nr:hypothetical protein PRIPAC_84165 [Pristionchus pacificus]|eukprot:PDM66796.1 Peptidase [Pristionchus pacificus]
MIPQVHFKYELNGYWHRICPSKESIEEQLEFIKSNVSEKIPGRSFSLFWKGHSSDLVAAPLETTEDLCKAMDCARAYVHKTKDGVPCVSLDIRPDTVTPTATAALAAHIAAASSPQQQQIMTASGNKMVPLSSRITTPITRNPQSKLAQALSAPPLQRQMTMKQSLLASTLRSTNQSVDQRLVAHTRRSPTVSHTVSPPMLEQQTMRLSEGEVEGEHVGEAELKALTPSPDLADEDKENRMVKVRRTVEQVQKRQQLFGRSVQPSTPSPSSLTPPTTPSSSAIASARAQQISAAQKRLANRQAVAPYSRTSPAPSNKSASASPTYSCSFNAPLKYAPRPSTPSTPVSEGDRTILSNKFTNLALPETPYESSGITEIDEDEGMEEMREEEMEEGEMEEMEFEEEMNHNWLLLENNGNDCFLNAAVQYMRRTTDLVEALKSRMNVIMMEMETAKESKEEEEEKDEKKIAKQKNKNNTQMMLSVYLNWKKGRINPQHLRERLHKTIDNLERFFLYTQQDAYEILIKIFDDVLPESIAKQFSIDFCTRRRCRDKADCKGEENKAGGPIYYQHIEENNQILDLEDVFSNEWKGVEAENETRHCSACCECCQENKGDKTHDDDKCEKCKEVPLSPYVKEECFGFGGSSNYALMAFSILHPGMRLNWNLSSNCDLDEIEMMGHLWQAVSVIRHSGRVTPYGSSGHYTAYTKQTDGKWYHHDDDEVPYSVGAQFRKPRDDGTTDMQGVLAILFEKISV